MLIFRMFEIVSWLLIPMVEINALYSKSALPCYFPIDRSMGGVVFRSFVWLTTRLVVPSYFEIQRCNVEPCSYL